MKSWQDIVSHLRGRGEEEAATLITEWAAERPKPPGPDPRFWPAWRYRLREDGAIEKEIFERPEDVPGPEWKNNPGQCVPPVKLVTKEPAPKPMSLPTPKGS